MTYAGNLIHLQFLKYVVGPNILYYVKTIPIH